MNAPSPIRASVVIVSYNSRKHLEHGLPGIVGSLEENDELLLVDNASTDGTVDWIWQEFPRIKVIVSESNLGFGGGNNLGVEHAGGEYVVFINPDTAVEPGWLNALIQPLKVEHGFQLVTSRIVLMNDPARINTCGNDVHLSGITLCRGLGRPKEEYHTPDTVSAVSGAAFAMQRRLFLELGGFDADFFLYMEDTDLSLRARLAGFQVAYTPESIVQHAYELKTTPAKTYHQERNRFQMLLKIYRWGTLLVLLPVLLLGEAVTWGYVLLGEHGRVGKKLEAYHWVGKNWKKILTKRKQVQLQRRIPDRVLIAEMTSRLEIIQVEAGWLGKTATLGFSVLFFILKLWVRLWIWW